MATIPMESAANFGPIEQDSLSTSASEVSDVEIDTLAKRIEIQIEQNEERLAELPEPDVDNLVGGTINVQDLL